MNPPVSLLCLLVCLLTTPLCAQTSSHAVNIPVRQFASYHNTDKNLSHLNFFEKMGAPMQIAARDMVLESQNTDNKGFTHYKYQQYHQGLPIFGCHYFLHEKKGWIHSANGRFQPNANASTQATLNASGAVSFALRAMHSRRYDQEKTKVSLCFFNPTPGISARSLRLAYRVDFHSIEPFDKRRYFIDANTGAVLKEYPLLLNEGVPSKALTYYYGVQDIVSDSIGPEQFVLRDLTRGQGIFVYNLNTGDLFTNTSTFWDLSAGGKAEAGLDAHYCTEKYYDMMLADYGWEGVNGQGGALIANVHDGAYVNAYWDGQSTTYGDGDCHYGPLTTLEVVGHEFTHGMVDYTSKLVYNSESGAMNESLADMFGKLLERKVDPGNFSWDLGHSVLLDTEAEPFRVMDDPLSVGMPAYYKGQYWDDNNDVHSNSSIGNLWFSMVVDGKQGTNEAGYTYNVTALGPDKAGQIIFNANKNYLSEYATYNDFCNSSIEVAGNLYGQGSPEQLAVAEAWKAVGLPYVSVPTETFDLQLGSENPYYYLSICGLGQYIPISVSVTNDGTLPYTAANPATITLSNPDLTSYVITLTDPIAPGETLEFLVDQWFKPVEYGYHPVFFSLDLQDDNPNNNNYYGSYNVVQYAHDDIDFSAYLVQPECFDTSQEVYFYATNKSCEPIPVGTKMQIVGKNGLGNTVWTGPEETVSIEIAAGFSTTFIYEIPVFSEPITFSLEYPADPDLSNNQFDTGLPAAIKPIVGNYLNDFELNNGEDGYLDLKYPGAYPTIEYQNSLFFATTGNLTDPTFFEHCTDPLLAFDNPYSLGINGAIYACVDLSSAPAPALEFDAAMFLNSASNANNYLYSSMIQANWESVADTGSLIIYNQPEGAVKHTKIELPPFFKGKLSLYMYTELGHWVPNVDYLNEDDFVLLDNFKLSGATSAGHEAHSENGIRLSPNPAQETAGIQSEIPMVTIGIFNASGQLIKILDAEGLQQNIDLKGIPEGLYWVSIRLENGAESVQKLVKID